MAPAGQNIAMQIIMYSIATNQLVCLYAYWATTATCFGYTCMLLNKVCNSYLDASIHQLHVCSKYARVVCPSVFLFGCRGHFSQKRAHSIPLFTDCALIWTGLLFGISPCCVHISNVDFEQHAYSHTAIV